VANTATRHRAHSPVGSTAANQRENETDVFVARVKQQASMVTPDTSRAVDALRAQAAGLFAKGKYSAAADLYTEGITLCPHQAGKSVHCMRM
jgi:hypothetical protein